MNFWSFIANQRGDAVEFRLARCAGIFSLGVCYGENTGIFEWMVEKIQGVCRFVASAGCALTGNVNCELTRHFIPYPTIPANQQRDICSVDCPVRETKV